MAGFFVPSAQYSYSHYFCYPFQFGHRCALLRGTDGAHDAAFIRYSGLDLCNASTNCLAAY